MLKFKEILRLACSVIYVNAHRPTPLAADDIEKQELVSANIPDKDPRNVRLFVSYLRKEMLLIHVI